VLKIEEFSIAKILREINVGGFEGLKCCCFDSFVSSSEF